MFRSATFQPGSIDVLSMPKPDMPLDLMVVRAFMMRANLVSLNGNLSAIPKIEVHIKRMTRRPTVCWSDMAKLNRFTPGFVDDFAKGYACDRDVIRKACADGGIETEAFLSQLGIYYEWKFVGTVGVDTAKEWSRRYAKASQAMASVEHPHDLLEIEKAVSKALAAVDAADLQ